MTSELVEKARTAVFEIRSTVFLRSGDALHLACAEEHGFDEVYTNDRHMLKVAQRRQSRWTDGGQPKEG